jgi:abortive infection bacteriophage resistance protein
MSLNKPSKKIFFSKFIIFIILIQNKKNKKHNKIKTHKTILDSYHNKKLENVLTIYNLPNTHKNFKINKLKFYVCN